MDSLSLSLSRRGGKWFVELAHNVTSLLAISGDSKWPITGLQFSDIRDVHPTYQKTAIKARKTLLINKFKTFMVAVQAWPPLANSPILSFAFLLSLFFTFYN